METPHPGITRKYKGRNDSQVPINIQLDREALVILHDYAPGRRGFGRLVSRLLYEHAARQAAGKRIKESVRKALRKATREATTEGNND